MFADNIQKRFEELEKKYRFIADNLIDAVAVLDADSLSFEYITPSIEDMSGYSPQSFLSRPLAMLLTHDSYDEVIKTFTEAGKSFEKGISAKRSIEAAVIAQDGHNFWIEITGKFYKAEDGRLKIVAVLKDITSRKLMEKDREDLIEELKKTLEEKEKLYKENRLLRQLLPVCASCKRIRAENGKWWPLDAYVSQKIGATITHTICPDCRDALYDD